jgi:hypothetical protein
MKEITKEQFKEIFFANPDPEISDLKYQQDYWDKFYELETGVKYFYTEPESEKHNRMMIVKDYANKLQVVYRIFFMTEEADDFMSKPDFEGKWD